MRVQESKQMLQWVEAGTMKIAKGYSITFYRAEGTAAVIQKRKLTPGIEIFLAHVPGKGVSRFLTFEEAKEYAESLLEAGSS